MIKRLRLKFIAIAMASMFAVLAIVIAAVNVLNYQSIVSKADSTLSLLEQNGGRFPLHDNKHFSGTPGLFLPEDIQQFSPELPYESRFFSVVITESGEAISSDTANIAAVSAEDAAALAMRAVRSGKSRGFIGNYRFTVVTAKSGTQIIFLDCTQALSTFKNFLVLSCGISLAGLATVFVLIVLLSGWIIQPVSESYEKQKRFITDAGHEIKTPITIIDADAEVLEMDMPENEWLQDIRKQVKRLGTLTNDLIYLSRMDEEQVRLQMIDFPLSDMVAEAAQSFSALAVTQSKQFYTDIQPMLTQNGDEKGMRQLVSILLDNAVKYAPAGGVITLSLKGQGKFLYMTVSNTTAEPVTQDTLAHLFDRFYRADASRHSQGHGIGLSIAKAVVTAHKGKITATSADGQSLTVSVMLPR